MKIYNNYSPSFGSIQIRSSMMSSAQRNLSEKLCEIIKYSDKYAKHMENNLDVYILPAAKDAIKARIMDPFSGTFIRNKDGKIVESQVRETYSEKFDKALDTILDTYDNVMHGIIPRPKVNFSNVVENKTEMAKLNPDRLALFDSGIEEWQKSEGISENDAIVYAFDEFKRLYPSKNLDAEF